MKNYIVRKATHEDLDECLDVLKASVANMHDTGLFQWDDKYPNREVLSADIASGSLHIIYAEARIAGFAAFDLNEPMEYKAIPFHFAAPAMFVHRVCIDPACQRMGLAFSLMQFAFDYAKANGCRSVRLDTRQDNSAALALYKKLGFSIRGIVHFPRCPGYDFPCMEISLY